MIPSRGLGLDFCLQMLELFFSTRPLVSKASRAAATSSSLLFERSLSALGEDAIANHPGTRNDEEVLERAAILHARRPEASLSQNG